MKRLNLTIALGLAIETTKGSKFTLATKLTILPKRLPDILGKLGRMVLNALVPCPAYLAG